MTEGRHLVTTDTFLVEHWQSKSDRILYSTICVHHMENTPVCGQLGQTNGTNNTTISCQGQYLPSFLVTFALTAHFVNSSVP